MPMLSPPPEAELTAPVVSLFPGTQFRCYKEVPLARKRIDLVFVRYRPNRTISIELKVSDWKAALWQAIVNFQICDESYIAIWHSFVHRAERQAGLLGSYGIGLIAVDRTSADIVLPSREPPVKIPRSKKQDWYRSLLAADRPGASE